MSIILSVSLAVGGLAIYACHQLSKLPNLTFKEALAYTTQNNPDAVISVDVIKDGEMSYTVYGKNGVELPADLHTYEIGSLTKTFTAVLINQAITQWKIHLNNIGLKNTKIFQKNGDLENYWDLKNEDAYLSAGAITSDISDMFLYAQMQLENNPYFSRCHKSLAVVNATSDSNKAMNGSLQPY